MRTLPFFLLFAACLEPTEILLQIRTDVPCDRVASTDIVVETTTIAHTSTCSAGFIGSFVLVPSNRASSGTVDVGLTFKTGEMIHARRELSFVSHHALTVPIELSQACVGLVCDVDTTCLNGQCVSTRVGGDF